MNLNLLRFAAAFVALAFLPAHALAQSTCHALNDTTTFLNTVSTGNAWFALRVDLPASTTVSRVELFTGEVTALHQVDLWSHDASTGKPLTLLGSGPFPITLTNAWQGANLTAPVALTGGQTYWSCGARPSVRRRASTSSARAPVRCGRSPSTAPRPGSRRSSRTTGSGSTASSARA